MNWIGVRNPLSEKEVIDIGRSIGIMFPKEFSSSFGAINGGALKTASVNVPGLGKVAYSRNLNLLENVKGNALVIYKVLQEEKVDGFPFGSVGNGDYFCIDLRNGEIFLWQHESDRVITVCKNFKEFLDDFLQ